MIRKLGIKPKKKSLDAEGTEFIEEALCFVRGDKQMGNEDYDPTNIYAPVNSYDATRMMISTAASEKHRLEGAAGMKRFSERHCEAHGQVRKSCFGILVALANLHRTSIVFRKLIVRKCNGASSEVDENSPESKFFMKWDFELITNQFELIYPVNTH